MRTSRVVTHVNPPALVIPPGTTQHIPNGLRADHKEARSLIQEMVKLRQTFTQQLTQAITSTYLRFFRNRHSNSITTPIPDILHQLFTTYGKITEDELSAAYKL